MLKCPHCHRPITGKALIYDDYDYHPECVVEIKIMRSAIKRAALEALVAELEAYSQFLYIYTKHEIYTEWDFGWHCGAEMATRAAIDKLRALLDANKTQEASE